MLVAYNEGPIEKRRVHVSSLRDASGPVAVNVCEDCFGPWDWSPDNSHLLYWPQNRRQIGLLEVQSGQTAIVLAEDKYSLLRASFSPDGRWIVFNADLAFDRSQTFIAPFRGTVFHLHGARRSVSYLSPGFVEISVARDRIVFTMSAPATCGWPSGNREALAGSHTFASLVFDGKHICSLH